MKNRMLFGDGLSPGAKMKSSDSGPDLTFGVLRGRAGSANQCKTMKKIVIVGAAA